MKKVIVLQASVKEAKIEEFLKLAKIMVNKSLSEVGCLTYKLSKDLNKENDFFFYEKYENEEAVANHNSSEYFKEFINYVMPLLTKEPVTESFNA